MGRFHFFNAKDTKSAWKGQRKISAFFAKILAWFALKIPTVAMNSLNFLLQSHSKSKIGCCMETKIKIRNLGTDVSAISKDIAETLAFTFSSLKKAITHPFKPLPCLLICIPSGEDDEGRSVNYQYFACEFTEDGDKVHWIDHENVPDKNPNIILTGVLDYDVPYLEHLVNNSRHPEYRQGNYGQFSANPLHIFDSVIYIFGLVFDKLKENHYCNIANQIISDIETLLDVNLQESPNPLDALKKTKKMIGDEYRIMEIAKKAVLMELGWFAFMLLFEPPKEPPERNIHYIHNWGEKLFLLCHKISVKRLESEECKGYLALTPRDKATPDIPISGLPIKDNLIRKLLPLTSENMAVLCDDQSVYGIGNTAVSGDRYIKIEFASHGCWNVYCHGRLHASFRHGYLQYKPQVDYKKHIEAIGANRLAVDKQEKLQKIIEKVISTKHGTTIVFHENGREQAERLSKRGYLINDPGLNIDENNLNLLDHMVAIDGAMMFDFELTCHSIGLILDGTVTSDNAGEKARGARYNSACTYVENTGGDAFAVVISEDGMVDFFPDLESSD